jgi:hypothetical protein
VRLPVPNRPAQPRLQFVEEVPSRTSDDKYKVRAVGDCDADLAVLCCPQVPHGIILRLSSFLSASSTTLIRKPVTSCRRTGPSRTPAHRSRFCARPASFPNPFVLTRASNSNPYTNQVPHSSISRRLSWFVVHKHHHCLSQ